MESIHPTAAPSQSFPQESCGHSALPTNSAVEGGRANLPRMIWPVYGFAADMAFKREPVASFFDWGAAVDLVNHPDRDGFERRELYVGIPQYDRRSVPPIPARHLRHFLDGEALS